MEGVSYEAASLAGTNGLGKLIYFYDDNHITIDGTTSISFTRGPRAALRGARLARADGRRTSNDLDALRARDRRRAGRDGAPVADHRPLAHRLSARRTRSTPRRRTARRSATDEVARDEEGARLGSRQALLRPGRGLRAHERASSAATQLETEWQRGVRGAGRRRSPTLREKWDAAWRGPHRRVDAARRSRPARSSRRATPASR